MHNYHEKEREKYRKEQTEGSILFALTGLGLMAAFVPVAIITVGSMQVYKKIRGALKK